jgi:hypothetical protein
LLTIVSYYLYIIDNNIYIIAIILQDRLSIVVV